MQDTLSEQPRFRFSAKAAYAVFLAVISIVVYANSFRNGYVLDDRAVITNNSIVTKGFAGISQIFNTPYLRGFVINSNDLYRPLSLAMFAAEYQLFHSSPVASHVINVLFFSGCVLLLFFFLNAFFENRKTTVAFIAALLFALHPIHTEVVDNIKSRDELLCFFFAFLSLMAFLQYCRRGNVFVLFFGACSYFLSLLGKETSITFILIVPLIFCFYRHDRKRAIYITATTMLTAATYLLLRSAVLEAYQANHPFQVGITENALAGAHTVSSRLATAVLVLGYYLKQLFIPYPLLCDYSYNSIPIVSFGNMKVIVSLIVYLLMIGVGTYRLLRKQRDPYAFAILFFLLTLSLCSNIFFLVGATMAERFLFFPSVGFCLVAALLIDKMGTRLQTKRLHFRNAPMLLVIFPLSLIYAGITLARNSDWIDSVTLYKTDVAHQPNSYRLYYYLGTELINYGTPASLDSLTVRTKLEGIADLKRAKNIYPPMAVLYAEIGNTYLELSQLDSAELYNGMAVQKNPRDTFTLNKLAGVYFKKQDYSESLRLCEQILSVDSGYGRAYRNMGACYLRMEKYDSAVAVLKTGLRHHEDNPTVNSFLAIAYDRLGKTDSADKYTQIVRFYNPGFNVK